MNRDKIMPKGKLNNPNAAKNLIPYVKGQSGNPAGRPRRTVKAVIDALEEKGIKRVTKQDVASIYERLLNVSINELKKIAKDNDQSALTSIIADAMLSGRGFDVIERMLDRAQGKADANVKLGADETIQKIINLGDGEPPE